MSQIQPHVHNQEMELKTQQNKDITNQLAQQNSLGSFSFHSEASHALTLAENNNLILSQQTPQALELKLEAAQIYLQQALAYYEQHQWTEAITACRNALNIDSNSSEAYKIWGNVLHRSGKTAEAIGYYAKAVEIQPSFAEVYANLGSIYAQKQQWHKAIHYYQKAIFIEPNFVGAYRSLAKVWEELGEAERALKYFCQALRLEPAILTPIQHMKLGTELWEEGKSEEAIACYRHAIKLNPNFREAYLKLAESLEKTGQWQEAVVYYRQGMELGDAKRNNQEQPLQGKRIANLLSQSQSTPRKLPTSQTKQLLLNPESQEKQRLLLAAKTPPDHQGNGQQLTQEREETKASKPDSAIAQVNLGSLYAQKQQWREAIACYREAIRLNPNCAEAYFKLAKVLVKLGKQDQALECLYRALSLNPQIAVGSKHLQLGNMLLQHQQIPQAIACYRQAIQLQPDLIEAYLLLGQTLETQNKGNEAIDCYQKATQIQPTCWQAYHALGDLLSKQQCWSDAIAAYNRAIEFNPDFSWSHNNLGDVFRELKDWQRAIAAYNRAIEFNPDFTWSYYNLGDAFGKQAEWEQAISAYRQAIKVDPNFAEAYSHLGDALVRQGKWDEAIVSYQKAIDLKPDLNVSVYQNLGEALERRKYLNQGLTTNQEVVKTDKSRWPYIPVHTYHPPKTLPDGSPWPKISIVTPSFNQGEFIEETILSVIHQDYPNLEHIIIDGGSTDETMTIVQKYRHHFSYVISESDNGQSEALNKGFRLASGEIFTWLNSDDRLAPGALYAVALAFYASSADIVAGVCQIFQDDLEVEQHLTSCANGQMLLDEILDVENYWLKGKFFYQPEVMFTKAIWEKAGASVNESLFYSMDYDLWARFAANDANIHVIGHPVAQYRMHANQKTSTIEKYEPELLQARDLLRVKFNRPHTQIKESSSPQNSLRIVFFNDTGFLGGAGIAHHRIAQACALAGHQVIPIAGTLDWSSTPVDCSAEEVYQLIANVNPDLVVVGNIHNLKRPLEILETIKTNFSTIFVMHDQWLLTGRCAYVGNCRKYTTFCDATCPTSKEYPSLAPSNINQAFAQKQTWLKDQDNLLVLGDSNWLTNWASHTLASHLSENNFSQLERKFQSIYYGIELDIFQPQDRQKCRRQLGLPEDKFIVLTGSQSIADERKGGKYLLKALEIAALDNLVLVSFGHGSNIESPVEIINTGYIDNPSLLSYYYSAADLFIGPSQQEAFGQTFVEASACGTPAIGYQVGGIPEAISDYVSGRIVTEKTPEALAQLIKELYHDPQQLQLLSQTAPLHVANRFSLQSSYHSLMSALAQSGWLDKLNLRPASKFVVHPPKLPQPLTIKGGMPPKTNNVISGTGIQGYTLAGFSDLEPPYADIGLFTPNQWLLWPRGKIAIIADETREGQLLISCRNILAQQFIEVLNNGNLLFRGLVQNAEINAANVFTIPISWQKGLNLLELKVDKYYEDQSHRRLAILLESITFTDKLDWQNWDNHRSNNALKEKLILMDENLQGLGWFPTEIFAGKSVRWMEKIGSVVVEGMETDQPLQIKISGITAIDRQFITNMVVKVDSHILEGQVQQLPNNSWEFSGIITTEMLTAGRHFLLSLESPDVKQLSPSDARCASLLIQSIAIKVMSQSS